MWRHSLHEPPGREAPIERASSGGRYYVDETWLLSMLRRWRHACMNSWCTSWCCGRLEGKGFGHEPLGKNENTLVMARKELGWERCQLCMWGDWVGLSMASCVDLMEQAGDGRGVHWVACCHVCWTGKATSSHAETRKGRHAWRKQSSWAAVLPVYVAGLHKGSWAGRWALEACWSYFIGPTWRVMEWICKKIGIGPKMGLIK